MSVLIVTSLLYALQTAGQKNTTTANAAIIMILEPMWTVVLSMLWYGEKMKLTKLIGCSLILFALLIYRAGAQLLRLINFGRSN